MPSSSFAHRFILCLFLLSRVGVCAQVLKLSQNPRFILVSSGPDDGWMKRERVCIFRGSRTLACGVIAKLSRSSAIVALDAQSEAVRAGDWVRSVQRDVASTSTIKAPARSSGGSELNLGFELGTNLAGASISPSPSPTPSLRLGGMVGGLLEIRLSGAIALRAGLLYTEKGPTFSQGSDSAVTRLDYIELCPQLVYSLPVAGPRVFFFSGPFLGYLIRAKGDETTGGITTETDLLDQVVRVDYGMEVGGGIGIPLGASVSLMGQVQYALGFANLQKGGSGSYHSRGIQLVAALLFTI
jgi:hypothetical protein